MWELWGLAAYGPKVRSPKFVTYSRVAFGALAQMLYVQPRVKGGERNCAAEVARVTPRWARRAWLDARGVPRTAGRVVQECGVGMAPVPIDDNLAFAARPQTRSGPVADMDVAVALSFLGVTPAHVVAEEWIDNGPGLGPLLLASAVAGGSAIRAGAKLVLPAGHVAPLAHSSANDEVRPLLRAFSYEGMMSERKLRTAEALLSSRL